MNIRWSVACVVLSGTVALADEGMWRIDQLPVTAIAEKYGVRLTPQDVERLQNAPVRILAGSGGGTGTFASANGLILTNHHVALDCIRTSTLAEQQKGKADNLIEQGFTAKSYVDELPCRRFRAQVERNAVDVTAQLNAGVTDTMDIAEIQRVRQARRSEIERTCKQQKGDDFSCAVVDFNSGARSLLITYEDYRDVRLVYAPEKQLGYFGGDEMNFRFPRYVSDISILRAYGSRDGTHGEFDASHVPVKPDHYLKVTMEGVKEGDFTLVAGNPGSTNRYRESYSAIYNVNKGIPERIKDYEDQLALLKMYAAMKPEYQVLLQEQIFGISNSLKYERDVLASLKETDVVAERQARERAFTAYLDAHPDQKARYGAVLDAQKAVYADSVEANAELDRALGWIQRASVVGYATGLYEFAVERAKASDVDREPQFQERHWPDVRQELLNDDPVIPELEEDLLTMGFEKAMALAPAQRVPAVTKLAERLGNGATPRSMARSVVGSKLTALDARKALIDASVSTFEASSDPAIVFARDFEPSVRDLRARIRLLNEKLLRNRAQFAQGLMAWKGQELYPDANFTLRVTFGKTAGYTDHGGKAVPFTTRFGDLFALANARGNRGDYAMPERLVAWRSKIGDAQFTEKYAGLPVDFVSDNDITGGNSGSATLNRSLQIVGLIFDGNEEGMAGDWTYNGTTGRALSTDIRFALTIAREVHGAGWIVDELLNPDKVMDTSAAR